MHLPEVWRSKAMRADLLGSYSSLTTLAESMADVEAARAKSTRRYFFLHKARPEWRYLARMASQLETETAFGAACIS